MKAKIVVIFFVFLIKQTITAQDDNDLSFFSNPTFINPAYCGTKTDLSNSHFSRLGLYHYFNNDKNLSSIKGISYDQYFVNAGAGLGIDVQKINHYRGFYSSDLMKLNYSYPIKLKGNNQLNLGINAGVEHRSINYYFPSFPDYSKFDPVFTGNLNSEPLNGNTTKYIPIVGFGALMQGKRYTIALSLNNLNQPNWSLTENETVRKPLKLQVNSTYFLLHKIKNNRVVQSHLGMYYAYQNAKQNYMLFSQNRYGKMLLDLVYYNREIYRYQTNVYQVNLGMHFKNCEFKIGILSNEDYWKYPQGYLSFIYLFENKRVKPCFNHLPSKLN